MACPNCGCKVTYQYDDTETAFDGGWDDLQRCAACGAVFGLEDELPEDDDDMTPNEQGQRQDAAGGLSD